MTAAKRFSAQTIAELELLARFDLSSRFSGVKIHHDAPADVLAAAQGLYDKGLITQADGGYLTDRGLELAEPLQRVLSSLEVLPVTTAAG